MVGIEVLVVVVGHLAGLEGVCGSGGGLRLLWSCGSLDDPQASKYLQFYSLGSEGGVFFNKSWVVVVGGSWWDCGGNFQLLDAFHEGCDNFEDGILLVRLCTCFPLTHF